MDPRLKAYQKQSRSIAVPEPEETATPVVRVPKLPKFELPTAIKPSTEATDNRQSLVKTTLAGDKSLRKVAKFLILLGQDEAAKVVRHLEAAQIEAIGQEIAGIKKIEPVEAEAILKEFGYLATTQVTTVKGGKNAAKAILHQAFGDAKAKSILHRAVPQSREKPFAFFAGLEPEVVVALLGPESPQVLSVVVPFLEKAQAGAFLKTLSPERRLDLIKRLAKMERVPSSVVAQVDQSLNERFHSLNPANTETIDGKARLADILRHMSLEKEEAILKSLDHTKPELTEDLRRRLFTPSDLVRIVDESFEDLMRLKDDAQAALVWLAGDDALRNKIEANVSGRRLLLIRAEVDLLSDTPKRQLQKELRFFLEEAREAVRAGQATLIDDNEEYL